MNKLMRKCQGAISVFLAIVLLPMMMFSAVFVDMGRIRLAKSMAESAGDLTLNTAMTNYDAELKDLYGLFATSQDMDELMESLEDYYRKSIIAAGVDEASADDYVGQIMGAVKGAATGTGDVMNIGLTGFEVSSPTGGNLGNPAILKSQIVEFMKYRGPINLGMGFLEALNCMKNMDKQTQLVEDKSAFYAEHRNLLQHLENAWNNIGHYQYDDSAAADGFPTGTYLKDKEEDMRKCHKNMLDAAEASINYLIEAELFKSAPYKVTHDAGTDTWKITGNIFGNETLKPYHSSGKKCKHVDDIIKYLNNVEGSVEAVKTAEGKVVGSIPQNVQDNIYKAYYVKLANKKANETSPNGASWRTYHGHVHYMIQNLVDLQGAYNNCSDEKLSTTCISRKDGKWVEDSSSSITLSSKVEEQLSNHLTTDESHIKIYNEICSRIKDYHSASEKEFNNASKLANGSVTNAQAVASSFYTFINGKNQKIEAAIASLNEAYNMIGNSGSTYNQSKRTWEGSMNAEGMENDALSVSNKKELEDLEKIITAEDVLKLKNRLEKISQSLEAILTAIDKFTTPNGTAWRNIVPNTISDTTLLSQSGNSELTLATKPSSYPSYITPLQNSIQSGTIVVDFKSNKDGDPNLLVNQLCLYNYLYNSYGKPSAAGTDCDKSVEDGDSDVENIKKDLKKTADDQKPEANNSSQTAVNRNLDGYRDVNALPSLRWAGEAEEVAAGSVDTDPDTALQTAKGGGLLSSIMKVASDMSTAARDKLYIGEYAMNMFSFDTQEAETLNKHNEKTGEKKELGSFYAKDGESYSPVEGYKDLAGEIRTLTKVSINPNMNFLYGDEIEYIIYGQNGTTKTYATIFGIRLALNTVYAFTDSQIKTTASAAATALFGYPPLTPLVPIAKVALTIGFAIAETAWDISQLRQGKAVPLMKNKDTWVMKPSGAVKAIKDEATHILQKAASDAANKVIDKGYNVLNSYLTMSSEEIDSLIQDRQDGLNDLANAATDSVKSSVLNYANDALQQAVDMVHQVNQEFMKRVDEGFEYKPGATPEKIQEVSDRLDAWLAEQSGLPDPVKEAQKAAVDYLKESSGAAISKLFEAVNPENRAAQASDYIEGRLNIMKQDIDAKINDLIETGAGALHEINQDITEDLQNAAKEGADALKKTIQDKVITKLGGSIKGDKNNKMVPNVVANLLNWRYSDYLRVFLAVGLLVNEEMVVLRIADLIELNMQHKNNEFAVVQTTKEVQKSRFWGLIKTKHTETVNEKNDKAFTLSKSMTYMQIHADLEVRPFFMTLPFMAETVENHLSGTNWYQIHYDGVLGY